MTCVLTGFSRHRNRIGTIYSNGTLTAADTDVNVYGTVTIAPPVSPSTNQIIQINNTGPGVVTVTGITTIAAGDSIIIYWSGINWGWALTDCSGGELPVDTDQGTTQYAGPAESAYVIPPTTQTDSTIATLPCGLTVVKRVTLTYSQRSDTTLNKYVLDNYYGGISQVLTDAGGLAGIVAYGAANPKYAASLSAACTAYQSGVYAFSPSPSINLSLDRRYEKYQISTVANKLRVFYNTYINSNGAFVSSTSFAEYAPVASVNNIQLYYLDVNEAWSYHVI